MFKRLLLLLSAAACVTSASADDLFFEDFAQSSGLDRFTILNENGDDNQWRWYGGEIFCHLNSTLQMDDWLITPALRVEAGKVYSLAFRAYATNHKNVERMEVKLGTSATVAGMNTELMAPTDISVLRGDNVVTTIFFQAPSTGEFFVGFHGISEPNRYNLYLDDIRVSGPMSADIPAAVSGLRVQADADAAPKATISFTLPSKTIVESALGEITSATIERDGVAVSTITDCRPGQEKTFVDTDVPTGKHTWTVRVANSHGISLDVSASAFVGPNVPLTPTGLVMKETSTPGKVTVTWNPVTSDIDGKTLSADMVKYTVTADDHVIGQNLSATTFTGQVLSATDPQEYMQVAVYATTASGDSDEALSPLAPIGTPYAVPFAESFANARYNTQWAVQNLTGSGYVQWKACKDDAGIPSFDGDNGVVAAYTPYVGDSGRFFSAKIDLNNVANPAFQVYYYNIEGGYNNISLIAKAMDDKDFTVLTTHRNTGDGWVRLMGRLDDFAGKNVLIGVQTMCNEHPDTKMYQNYTVFDNFRVFALSPVNVAATTFTAPAKVILGKPFEISAGIENNGNADADDVLVTLYNNGRPVAAKTVSVPCLEATTVTFEQTATVLFAESSVYYVELTLDGDTNQADNRTSSLTVKVDLPSLPTPTELTATAAGTTVQLAWTEPDISTGVAAGVCESFEDYEPGTTTDFGDWTLYDADEDITYGFEDSDFPHQFEEMAYMIFDSTWDDAAGVEDMAAHTGTKYAVAMACYYEDNDDWLISPRLNGEAQTVTFYARSYTDYYGKEAFEFLYSTTDTDPKSFTRAGFDSGVPARWTEYSYSVPEGALYFAIRCVSSDAFMFMVDDISFSPAGTTSEPLKILGYNIYRDGEKLNNEPVSETSFTDSNVPHGRHTYLATAIFDKGESRPSNEANVGVDGIVAVISNVTITAAEQTIYIEGGEGLPVAVTTPTGVTIFSATAASDRLAIPASPGFYIVRAGAKASKLLVR